MGIGDRFPDIDGRPLTEPLDEAEAVKLVAEPPDARTPPSGAPDGGVALVVATSR
jgi:hypothetical protein